jgi:hypothetical protein
MRLREPDRDTTTARAIAATLVAATPGPGR